MQVADTILKQLGGRRFCAMTGATNIMGDEDSLSLQIAAKNDRKIKGLRITLLPSDTYSVIFYRRAKKDPATGLRLGMTVVSEHEGVFADQLRDLFTSETGLLTHL